MGRCVSVRVRGNLWEPIGGGKHEREVVGSPRDGEQVEVEHTQHKVQEGALHYLLGLPGEGKRGGVQE